MPSYDLANEASKCRSLALELEGRPEVPILLRLASEFNQLASRQERPSSDHEEDGRYFKQRAAQEVRAAVRAAHPKARLAHLKMAQSYEARSQESDAHMRAQ
jgi:hypothetical protein